MENNKPTYIIFGASGDLSKRFLLPALENMQNMNYVGRVVHISRKDYGNLRDLIANDGDLPAQAGKIFHLAIPPEAVPDVVKIISNVFGRDKVKIMLEKPFGKDLKSAQDLIKHIDQYLSEHQIYRVDHYLAKRSMQNLATEKLEKDKIAGIEARGFIFGAALAHQLNLPFVLIRKKGKLPAETVSQEYALEYGTDKIEMHKDAVDAGENVLIVDDLMATAGTAKAACLLIEKLGGKVQECAFVIELPELRGREKLVGYNIFSLVKFERE